MKHTLHFTAALFAVAFFFASCAADLSDEKDSAHSEPVFYSLDFNSDYGNLPGEKRVLQGTVLTEDVLPVLEADGMDFLGWYDEGGNEARGQIVYKDMNFIARWKTGTSASYYVHYMFQTLEGDGYYCMEFLNEKLSGVPFEMTDVKPLNFSGFIAQEIVQKQILPEGKTVINVYNDRENVTLTLQIDEQNVQYISGLFGTEVIVPVLQKEGEEFLGWEPPLPQVFTNDGVYVAKWRDPNAEEDLPEPHSITYFYDNKKVTPQNQSVVTSYAGETIFSPSFYDLGVDGECVYWAVISSEKGVVKQQYGTSFSVSIDPSWGDINVKFYSY